MLDSQEDGEEDRDFIVQAVEWGNMVLVPPVEWPYTWSYKI